MDGGRRLLRPVRDVFAGSQPSLPAYVGVSNIASSSVERHAATRGRRASARRGAASRFTKLFRRLTARGTGAVAAFAFIAGVGLYGAVLGGQYAAFTASEGDLPDFVARVLGFGVKAVTISGAQDLSDEQILDAIGIRHTNSLVFLDVGKLRDRLKALPLVKDASVSKLYPNRVMIEIEERKPFALWQKDGAVKIVAADGTPIDALNDQHFFSLPLVVGDGANARIADYLALLDVAGELRPRIKAGILVAQRRWTLKMANGVEVALPETGAAAAVAKLALLQHEYGVLDKDIVSLDLRIPGRLIARLPDDAARARADASVAKPKGGQT
jgi:cell division protein FtsQ